METKTCISCGVAKELNYFSVSYKDTDANVKYGDKYKNRCKACYAERYRLKLKYDFVNAYGGKCQCCGEDDFRFLTLDHIGNDGNVHRELLQCQQILALARKESFPKDKYALLCFNCNSGRSCNGGICPHKSQNKEIAFKELQDKLVNVGRKHVSINYSNLPEAREKYRQNLIASGYSGIPKTAAEKSKDYREKHPEYKTRKQFNRLFKQMKSEDLEQLLKTFKRD